jgi:hypothetical protein
MAAGGDDEGGVTVFAAMVFLSSLLLFLFLLCFVWFFFFNLCCLIYLAPISIYFFSFSSPFLQHASLFSLKNFSPLFLSFPLPKKSPPWFPFFFVLLELLSS